MRARDFDADAEARLLWTQCARFWDEESRIVRRYLKGPRNADGDIRWLRLAAFKETRLYRELPEPLRRCFDAGQAVPGMSEAQLIVLQQEMEHYQAIAGLVRILGARPPGPTEELDFPANAQLQHLRASLRDSGDDLSRCASQLVEGGGGAMYRELSHLHESPFDVQVARVFSRILDDEMDHGPGQLPRLAALLGGPADAARARAILDELGALRVRMRAEMFFCG